MPRGRAILTPSVVVVVAFLCIMRKKRKARKVRAASSVDAKQKSKKGDGSQELREMFCMVWPGRLGRGWFTVDVSRPGGWYLAGLLLTGLARTGLHGYNLELTKRIMTSLYSRDRVAFQGILSTQLLLGVGFALQRNIIDYCGQNLCLVWRQQLTNILHSNYFASMSYYFVQFDQKVTDPDERITEDVKSVTEGIQLSLQLLVYSLSSGLYFGAMHIKEAFFGEGMRELAIHSKLLYAFAPILFMSGAVVLQKAIAGISSSEFGILKGQLGKAFGEYRAAVVRTQLHSESIAALKGANVENGIISHLFEKTMEVQRTVWAKLIRLQASYQIAFFVGMPWFLKIIAIGPGVFTTHALRDRASNVSALADTNFRMSNALQMSIGIGMLSYAFQVISQNTGTAQRIMQMIRVLKELQQKKKSERRTSYKKANMIEFTGVDIETPTGNRLVNNLSFRLDIGDSLLLTGHNGAGKSSIFRCLGGLWTIPKGTITKPGSAEGLNVDVFYIPQKPYQVLGTLSEQLTYPVLEGSAAALSEPELRNILKQVDLAYLLDRPGALTQETNWEEALSLGEKQRIAIARLIYRKPDFAILDECTSAVSSEQEIALYRICAQLNVTYITISHRPALMAFHDRTLAIGDGKQGWCLTNIDRAQHLARFERNLQQKAVPANVELLIKQQQDQRSNPYRTRVKRVQQQRALPKRSTLQRVRRLWSIAMPSGGLGHLFRIASLVILRTGFGWFDVYLTSEMMKCLTTGLRERFLSIVATSALTLFLVAFSQEGITWAQNLLCGEMRENLTAHFLKEYFTDNSFYKLRELDGRIKDPEQRIVNDIEEICKTVASMFTEAAQPALDLLAYGYVLSSLVDLRGMAIVFGYNLVGVGFVRAFMPDYKKIAETTNALEGKLKYVHSRIVQHSESIAFFGGDSFEKTVADSRAEDLWVVRKAKINKDILFGVPNQFFTDASSTGSVPNILKFGMQFYYQHYQMSRPGARGHTNEAFATLVAGDQLMSQSITKTLDACSKLINFGEPLAQLTGVITRATDLDSVLLQLKDKSNVLSGTGTVGTVKLTDESRLAFQSVDIVTPTGDCMAADVTVEISPESAVMVTGAVAAGKTSFFRVLAGLWDSPTGTIVRPRNDKDVFLVPQRVYMVIGSLGDNITYPLIINPEIRTAAQATKMQECLNIVGIGFLTEREREDGKRSGFDTCKKWEDTLSLGEQQRLSMARLFFHEPKFGILDECTSAVSVDVEKALYEQAYNRGITCVTISQRIALEEFHKQELHLGAEVPLGYTMRQIGTAEIAGGAHDDGCGNASPSPWESGLLV